MNQAKENSPKDEQKRKIILTAIDAFRLNGIKSITMDDIAALLKMSKRTLYEMFSDKETLLMECLLYQQKYSRKKLKELVDNASNVLEVILTCYEASVSAYNETNMRFFEDVKKYPKVHALMKRNKEQDNEVVVNFMKKGVEQGLFRDDINFGIIQFLLKEQMELLIANRANEEFPFLETYESIMLTYTRGISTEKGREELDKFVTKYRAKKKARENGDDSESKKEDIWI